MTRCVTCGRVPSEGHCEQCHAVQERVERETRPHKVIHQRMLKSAHPERPSCDCHGLKMWADNLYWRCRYAWGTPPQSTLDIVQVND